MRVLHSLRVCLSVTAIGVLFAGQAIAQSTTAPATGLNTLTLQQAEDAALRGNAQLRSARRALSNAQADVERAAARPNPQLSLELYNNRPQSYNWPNAGQRLRVDQLIERGNKRQLRSEAATSFEEAARLDVVDAIRQTRLAVRSAYWELAAAQRRSEIAQQTVDLLARLLSASERRLKVGDLSKVDLARLRVDAARVQNDARAALAQREAAQVALALAIGSTADARAASALGTAAASDAATVPAARLLQQGLVATEALPGDVVLPAATDSAQVDLDALIDNAVNARPDLRAARDRVRAAERLLELAYALRSRDVTVSAGAEHNGPGGGATVLAGVTVPIFTNYYFEGEIARARSELNGANEEFGRIKQLAGSEIARALAQLRAAADQLKRAREQIVPDADAAAAGVEFAFSRGAANLTDLLDAQRVRAATQRDAVEAALNYALAEVLWRAVTRAD